MVQEETFPTLLTSFGWSNNQMDMRKANKEHGQVQLHMGAHIHERMRDNRENEVCVTF